MQSGQNLHHLHTQTFFVLSSHKTPWYNFHFDSSMNFMKHFEDILKSCTNKFYRLRILVRQNWGLFAATILKIYKQCVTNHFKDLQTVCNADIRIWDYLYRNCFGHRRGQNSKSPELFYISGWHFASKNMSQPAYYMKSWNLHTSKRDLSL